MKVIDTQAIKKKLNLKYKYDADGRITGTFKLTGEGEEEIKEQIDLCCAGTFGGRFLKFDYFGGTFAYTPWCE